MAELSDLNAFVYLQHSEGSDDLIKKTRLWKDSL